MKLDRALLTLLQACASALLAAACNAPDTDVVDDTDPDTDPPGFCEITGRTSRPFDGEGPYGTHRHETAADFFVFHPDGSEWNLETSWTGCDTYVFIPEGVDGVGGDSIWASSLQELLDRAPDNVHYFFVTTKSDDAAVAAQDAMQARIDEVLAGMGEAEAADWGARLHVVNDKSDWVATVTRTIGKYGWAIDRNQQIRGLGSFSDVELYTGADGWPWDPALAYAAYDPLYFDMEAARDAALFPTPTTVPLWTGEVISMYADKTVTLPSAAEMATFDTFEVDIDMRCPDPDSPEFGNCGAWDYLAHLFVKDGEQWIELGRMITSYHRETHWVVDLTPMMAHLLDGGEQTFRWSWAPEWNVQPTETRLTLRFSNQGKAYKPRRATLVATGGSFNSGYNTGRTPKDVAIGAATKHVALWAVISGHGADSSTQCAEFCNHQHEFTIGGQSWLEEYPEAGTDAGCRDEGIPNQMTPNQWGTWWLGRGGWCPGQPVVPFEVDVTAQAPAGATASVTYRGLYKGKDPRDGAGDILMNAWLVEYE